ncbi:MAG: hypothetical protein IH968_13755 [Gemmatimonadetes bacterium]|nr:hypothetical protein [Gemmatimonadota bacterium]
MNWLTFTADVIASLAWPAVVVVAIAMLRKPLGRLIPLLRRFRYKDLLDFEFEERLEVIEAELLDELPPVSPLDVVPMPPLPADIVEVAKVSPRAAVLESWLGVERAAQELGRARGIYIPKDSPFQIIRGLEKADAVSSSLSSVLHELRSLRNEAAHAPDFALDEDSALSYSATARRAISSLVRSSTGGDAQD